MSKILIVDDEQKIREVIKSYLAYEGISCDEASDGKEAIDLVKENKYDVIVMDIMMKKVDGYTASKEIKKIVSTPIIMLSARSEEYDKLFGFEVGIDDYVTKPFSPKELVARIKVHLRKNEMVDVLKFNGLKIDLLGREVYVNEEKIKLTPKEFDLLVYFVENKNIALSREQILNTVWDMDYYGDDRTIDTHIKTLRNNLKEYKTLIKTVRGVGYKFEFDEK